MLLLDAFRVHALHNPGNVVVKDLRSGAEFVYRQIWNASELLGAHLIEQTAASTLAAGEPVAIFGCDEPLVLACIIACAKSKHPHYFFGDEDLSMCGGETEIADGGAVPLPDGTLLPGAAPGANGSCSVQQSPPVILTATNALADVAKQHFGDCKHVFSAELMLSYIVPGMADDFSCGCGAEDCAHGPFLQECMPSDWFAADGAFFVDDAGGACDGKGGAGDGRGNNCVEMTVAAHDEMLTAALMGEHSDSPAAASNGDALGGDVGFGGSDRLPDDMNRTSSPSKKRLPLNLCNPHLAVALATGETITLE